MFEEVTPQNSYVKFNNEKCIAQLVIYHCANQKQTDGWISYWTPQCPSLPLCQNLTPEPEMQNNKSLK